MSFYGKVLMYCTALVLRKAVSCMDWVSDAGENELNGAAILGVKVISGMGVTWLSGHRSIEGEAA